MTPKNFVHYLIILLTAVLLFSCSTTKLIPTGSSRLKANKVLLDAGSKVTSNDIVPYIKQKPNTYFILGWNPFLNIYNWGNGKGKCWDKFVKKIGQEPVIFDNDLITSSKKNINNHLLFLGYYNSVITDSVITKKKKTTVLYKVKPGTQYKINEIKYSIKDTSIKNLYFADTINSIIKLGTFLSEEKLNKESERATQEFRNKGYYGFTKNYFFFEADTIGLANSVNLLIKIEDYTRNEFATDAKSHKIFKIDSVIITPIRNNSKFSKNNRLIRTENDSISSQTIDTTVFNGVYLISKNTPLLRPKVSARMNLIVPGSVYNEKTIENTYSRFSNLRLFSSVNIQVNERDSNKVSCNIKLISSQLQGYKISLDASSNSSGLLGISPGLSYYHKNLFRGGEYFTLSFMGDFQFKANSNIRSTEFGISTSLSTPNFLLLPDKIFKSKTIPRTEFTVSYNYQQRPEYTRNIISATYGYSWNRYNKHFYKVNPIQVSIVKLFDLSEEFFGNLRDPFLKNSYQDHFDFGLGGTYYYTTDASQTPSKSYFYLRAQADVSGNLLSAFNKLLDSNLIGSRLIWGSPYSQYARGEVSGVYTWKFGKNVNQSLAARLLVGAGLGYGNSSALPFEKLFWSGGANSLRAWQARTVGPGYAQVDTLFTIPNQTGSMKIEANLEYRFPLFWMFEGALFADVGNVWNFRDSSEYEDDTYQLNKSFFSFKDFYKHLAFDWGLGIRLNFGFALIRLDMGFKTFDPALDLWLGPKQWFKKGNYGIQFGVGYPF